MTQPRLTGRAGRHSPLRVVIQTVVSLALLGGAVAAVAVLGGAEPPPQAPPATLAPVVAVAIAEPHDEPLRFSVDGVVQTHRDLDVAAESGGRVIEKAPHCQAGERVTAGEVLVRVDTRDYELEVERLRQELAREESSLAELGVQMRSTQQQLALAEEVLALNDRELRRVTSIGSRGAITASEIDTTRRDVVNARISLQSQSDQLQLFQASVPRLTAVIERTKSQLAAAELALERCEVRAPIDGVVTQEYVEQGGYLQAGSVVFTVRDTSRVDVRCTLRADQLALLWDLAQEPQETGYEFPRTPVSVEYELGDRQYAWAGVLDRYDGAGLDPQTRMAPCIVEVTSPRAARAIGDERYTTRSRPPTLLVGTFVEVVVELQTRTPLVRVPMTAVRPGGQVWVVSDGVATSRKVRGVGTTADSILVFADERGIVPGDRVIVSSLASPSEGMAVRVATPLGEAS